MSVTLTLKFCGICGKLVKDKDSWVTVPTMSPTKDLDVVKCYHLKCYDEDIRN